jgi:putative ABC transport system permease protein
MLRATWRGLLSHKVRLLLTAVAVVLGVAFVSGSLVFTDTLKKTFDDLFTQTSPDVVLTPRSAFTVEQDRQNGALTLPASELATVRAVEGVQRARGAVFVNGVQVVGRDGKVLGQPGVPAFGSNWSDDPKLSPLHLVDGRGPTTAGEVALDTQTASKAGLSVGSTAELTTPTGTRHDRVVGLFRFGTTGNLAGASITAFDLRTAQRVLLGGADAYSQISATAQPGVSQQQLRDRVVAALGPQAATTKVQTGKQAADEQAKQITNGLKFFNIFLLVFAGIALVVGSFIILNTFSMLVAQRTRELALLRAIGASRRQVTRSVLLEALVVGVVGSTVGLALGVLLSLGLRGLFSALGVDFPAGPLVISGRTVLVAYAVGVVVTLVAAYFPARRASQVSPMAALRTDARPTARSLRLRTWVGAAVIAAGAAVLVTGMRATGNGAPLGVGIGAVLVLVGSVVLSPSLSRPVIGWVAAPLARSGATGRIAVDNARRNPRRTASTASALMIGLALVSAIGVLGASTTASTDAVIDKVVKADFIATNVTFLPLSPQVAKTLQGVEGVGTVSRVQALPVLLPTGTTALTVVDPATITQMLSIDMVSGSLSGLDTNGLVVDQPTATAEGLHLGSRLRAQFLSGKRATLVVEGVYKSSGAFTGGVVATSTAREAGARDLDEAVYLRLAPGADVTSTRAAIDRAMAAYPNVKVQDQTEFKQSIRSQIDQLLYVVYALLALAVVIAVLGIVNTLALSVVERTREIGLLRALGMDRRQLRRTVRWESVSISVYGALLGLVIGLAFGVALQRSLVDQGITALGIPWPVLVTVILLSVLVGVLAAVWPARRAARLDLLQAITSE